MNLASTRECPVGVGRGAGGKGGARGIVAIPRHILCARGGDTRDDCVGRIGGAEIHTVAAHDDLEGGGTGDRKPERAARTRQGA